MQKEKRRKQSIDEDIKVIINAIFLLYFANHHDELAQPTSAVFPGKTRSIRGALLEPVEFSGIRAFTDAFVGYN
jgi:hypothetical protein